MRRRWLSLCTVWPSHLQISSLSKAIFAVGKARSCGKPNQGCRMGRRIVVMKLIGSFGHCESDVHTVHKLNQRRLTADWLAPRESDCSRINSKVSSDRLPSYIKATPTVQEIFKVDRYFPDCPFSDMHYPWQTDSTRAWEWFIKSWFRNCSLGYSVQIVTLFYKFDRVSKILCFVMLTVSSVNFTTNCWIVAWQPSVVMVSSLSGCNGKIDTFLWLQHELTHEIDGISIVKGT